MRFMNPSRDTLFGQPLVQVPDFIFNEDVARVFPDMIKRSVPGYPTIVENSGVLAAQFAKPNSLIYDLGCALGAVTQAMRRHVRVEGGRIVAVDNSNAMVERCREYLNAQDAMHQELLPAEVLNADILQLELQRCSVVALNFTLQFIPPAQRLQLLMAELDGDEAAQMDIWNARLEGRSDTTHELMNMAQVQWWNGHYDKARVYAQAALTQLEDLIPRRRKQEVLYRSRRSIVLALLGRIDEARAELAAVRQLPLCEGCDYCTCKDADIFEANMEEICGHWEQALALHRAGAERWHDDLDFVSGMRRMMRKGYSHDDRH